MGISIGGIVKVDLREDPYHGKTGKVVGNCWVGVTVDLNVDEKKIIRRTYDESYLKKV